MVSFLWGEKEISVPALLLSLSFLEIPRPFPGIPVAMSMPLAVFCETQIRALFSYVSSPGSAPTGAFLERLFPALNLFWSPIGSFSFSVLWACPETLLSRSRWSSSGVIQTTPSALFSLASIALILTSQQAAQYQRFWDLNWGQEYLGLGSTSVFFWIYISMLLFAC